MISAEVRRLQELADCLSVQRSMDGEYDEDLVTELIVATQPVVVEVGDADVYMEAQDKEIESLNGRIEEHESHRKLIAALKNARWYQAPQTISFGSILLTDIGMSADETITVYGSPEAVELLKDALRVGK